MKVFKSKLTATTFMDFVKRSPVLLTTAIFLKNEKPPENAAISSTSGHK